MCVSLQSVKDVVGHVPLAKSHGLDQLKEKKRPNEVPKWKIFMNMYNYKIWETWREPYNIVTCRRNVVWHFKGKRIRTCEVCQKEGIISIAILAVHFDCKKPSHIIWHPFQWSFNSHQTPPSLFINICVSLTLNIDEKSWSHSFIACIILILY